MPRWDGAVPVPNHDQKETSSMERRSFVRGAGLAGVLAAGAATLIWNLPPDMSPTFFANTSAAP